MAKNGQILVLNGRNFAISEFSRYIEYDSLKEDYKNNFHTICLEVIGRKLSKLSILAKNGQILVLNGQNFAISEFSRHIQYDFLKEDHKKNFHIKIRKIHSGVWNLKAKNLQNCQFWPKDDQILATNGKILVISEFSWHIHYEFLKGDHKGSFHTKNYENL